MTLSTLERRLLDDFQRHFPLEPRPFARIGEAIGMNETDVIELIADLQGRGMISRVGAVVRANTVGASTLAALSVPEQQLVAVAQAISARAEVNHCYEREHSINLWFVVTAPDKAGVARVLAEIEDETGLPVLDLPMEEGYHIDLGFPLR